MAFLRTLSEGTGLDAAVFTPLYKILGIALVVHLGGQLLPGRRGIRPGGGAGDGGQRLRHAGGAAAPGAGI